jgi:hypothetical protein
MPIDNNILLTILYGRNEDNRFFSAGVGNFAFCSLLQAFPVFAIYRWMTGRTAGGPCGNNFAKNLPN